MIAGNKKKNKKGFMFAFVTIFLISIFVFVLYIATSNVMHAQQRAAAERTEAIVLNLFTKSLTEEYFNSFVKVAATDSLRAMLLYVNKTETALEDPEGFYREIIMNGTVPTYYSVTAVTKDFAMILIARNDSEEVTIAEIDSGSSPSTESFGNEITIAQRIAAPESIGTVENLKNVQLTIINNSATSSDLYLAVYNSSQILVGMDHLMFHEGQENYTFTIGGNLQLTTDDYYDLVLAAPFTNSNTDYSVAVSPSKAFTCSLSDSQCNMATWEILDPSETTGDEKNVPIDFYLDEAIVGEGFFRALENSFEEFGKEELNINTSITVTNITIEEKSPWTITVNASFVVNTNKVTVSFSDVASSGEAEITIIGLYDPYSILRIDLLSEEGRYHQIQMQNVSDDFSEADMYRHLAEHTFVFQEDAPSFLERFKGEDADGSNCCGIQAIYLDSDISSSIDEDDKGYSYVDYMFQESTQCDADGVTDPLYAINPSAYSTEFNAIGVSSTAPLLDYASVEFYHLDDNDLYIQATCPTASES